MKFANALHIFTNRKVKDRLFRAIFTKDKTALLQLYNALHNTSYTNPDELEIITIENIVYMSMKNDLAFVIAGIINLYEHQSTFNPNMPVRFLLYLAQEYQKLIAKQKANIYGTKLISLPTPQFFVFYNGDTNEPDEQILKLSNAFENKKETADIELSVHLLNINFEHNKELMQKCHRLWEYSYLIEQIKKNLANGMSQHHAIDNAILHCINNDILTDFLQGNRMEVLGMPLTEYNEKKVMRALKRKQLKTGATKGLVSVGLKDGLKVGLRGSPKVTFSA